MPILAMPRLSDTMEEGTIVAWLVAPGAAVAVGDELVEIESDKATMTVQAELEGPLTVLAEEGAAVVVGEPIAWIGEGAPEVAGAADDGAAVADRADAAEGSAGVGGASTTGVAAAEAAPGAGPVAASDVPASPVARRAARQLGVDLGAVAGSGPRGRVLKADVEAHAASPADPTAGSAPSGPTAGASAAGDPRGDVEVVPLTRVQRTIADRMVAAKTAPEFVVEVDVDMTQAVALRAELKDTAADGDVIPSFNDFVVRAAALALRDHPEANAAYDPDGFRRFSRVNVGVAVAAEGTLVVPTVFDADRKSLAAVAADVRRLAAKVRDGAIEPADLVGGTFTVSNLGMFGVDRFVAVLNPPQSAILAVGRMTTQPAWDEATAAFVPRPTVRLTLTCDHRILYGADAARLLGRIRERLERPLRLAL
jgi:pyruvate dehydrogenase E2 component (dihydrolipoamide acetyltransferase)